MARILLSAERERHLNYTKCAINCHCREFPTFVTATPPPPACICETHTYSPAYGYRPTVLCYRQQATIDQSRGYIQWWRQRRVVLEL